MKKKWLLVTTVLLLALSGCQKAEEQVKQESEEVIPLPVEEQEETDEEIEEYPVELSKHLYDFEFAINGEAEKLPSTVQEWLEQGWEYVGEEETVLDTESYIEGKSLKRDAIEIKADVVNLEGEEKKEKDCYIGGVTLEYHKDSPVFQLPGNITLGKSNLNQVLEVYGIPTDEYSEKDDMYVTYEFGTYKTAEFVFDTEQEILYKATLKNYREPVSDEEEISKEEPAEVSAYQKPENFTENPADYIVSYDGALYEIPAPVSEFLNNGWKVQKEGSDAYVKSGRHGYVTLEKGDAVFYGVVKNYSQNTVPVEYTFLTKVSGDFDIVKIPISIGKEITLGMAEEAMKIQLGGSTYETQEEEQGVSYYLYSDETKKNFIRIFIDRDLKLIREIEISNSPETLAGYQKEEGADSSQESVPLGEGL